MPDDAMVPRLSFKSFSSIPIPLSLIVSVFALLSNVILIHGSKLKPLSGPSTRERYLSLSIASDELLISSLKKISLLE